jgi:hypothetical protein
VDFQRRATATELQSPASLKTHPGWLRDLYASFDDSSSDPGQPASSSTEQSYSTVSELLVPRAGRSLSRPRSGCLTRVLVEVCMASAIGRLGNMQDRWHPPVTMQGCGETFRQEPPSRCCAVFCLTGGPGQPNPFLNFRDDSQAIGDGDTSEARTAA